MIGIRVDDDVFLRLHEERHAEELFRLTEANREHLRPWMPWVDATRSSDDTRAYLRDTVRKFTEGRDYGFAILEHGALVGTIGIRPVEDASEAEIGYWISADAQGRGIVTRATEALIRFGFEDLGLNRIVILCAVDNQRSRAVPERLRFTIEGTLRRRELNPTREPRDQLLYGLLRSEWDARPSEGT
jgi:ribosomal-protein-serine acetyltransferase